jgi:hypothetical protein
MAVVRDPAFAAAADTARASAGKKTAAKPTAVNPTLTACEYRTGTPKTAHTPIIERHSTKKVTRRQRIRLSFLRHRTRYSA